MLIYALLHLTGYELSIEDIKQFRQLHSKTPGHPEFGYTPGVETTTGPLGQGLANAVGMAIAEKTLAAQFNREGHGIVDHHTWTFLGDGCLMEGISHEACSLAGTLGLGKLIAVYDDNGISIDGEVEGWFTDDTPKRFEAYGWHVIAGVDGHDPTAVEEALVAAKAETERPSLVCCKTVIGKGSPNKQGTESCHGAPLGDEEIALTREALGWQHGPFEIPEDVREIWNGTREVPNWSRAGRLGSTPTERLTPSWRMSFCDAYGVICRQGLPSMPMPISLSAVVAGADVASRKASQQALNAWARCCPSCWEGLRILRDPT